MGDLFTTKTESHHIVGRGGASKTRSAGSDGGRIPCVQEQEHHRVNPIGVLDGGYWGVCAD